MTCGSMGMEPNRGMCNSLANLKNAPIIFFSFFFLSLSLSD